MRSASTQRVAETIHRGLEGCNVDMIVSCYTDDAELNIIDRNHPPSAPLHLRGKQEIGDYYRDICSRQMQHSVNEEIVADNRLAFMEACEYSDGTRVLAAELCELANGKIARQLTVQAWDETPVGAMTK